MILTHMTRKPHRSTHISIKRDCKIILVNRHRIPRPISRRAPNTTKPEPQIVREILNSYLGTVPHCTHKIITALQTLKAIEYLRSPTLRHPRMHLDISLQHLPYCRAVAKKEEEKKKLRKQQNNRSHQLRERGHVGRKAPSPEKEKRGY